MAASAGLRHKKQQLIQELTLDNKTDGMESDDDPTKHSSKDTTIIPTTKVSDDENKMDHISSTPSKSKAMTNSGANNSASKKNSTAKPLSKNDDKVSNSTRSSKSNKLQIAKLEAEIEFLKRKHKMDIVNLTQEHQLNLKKIELQCTCDSDSDDGKFNTADGDKYIKNESIDYKQELDDDAQSKCSELSSRTKTKAWLDGMQKSYVVNTSTPKPGTSGQGIITTGRVKTSQNQGEQKVCRFDNINHPITNHDDDVGKSDIRDFIARQTISNDLPPFSGNPMEWPAFYNEYVTSTEYCKFKPYENIKRLRKALSGRAKESVQSLLFVPQKADAIIEILKERYGHPLHITNYLINEIKNFPKMKEEKLDLFLKFYDLLTNFISTLDTIEDKDDHINNLILFAEIFNKLPLGKRLSFMEYYDNLSTITPRLIVLHEWLAKKAKAASRLSAVTPYDENFKPKGTRPRETTLVTTDKPEIRNGICFFCKSTDHKIYKCEKYLKLDVDDKWSFVTKNSLCISCLAKGHSSKDCKVRKSCNIDGCKRPHNRLLHKEESNPKTPTENSKSSTTEIPKTTAFEVEKTFHVNTYHNEVLLKIIPIQIDGPLKTIDTFALLDDASTVSLIDENLANEIGLDGPIVPLRMQWTNNQIKEQSDSKAVSVTVRGKSENAKKYILRRVKTISELALPVQSVDFDSIKDTFPFLKKFSSYIPRHGKPMLLIGQDNWPVIVTRKMEYDRWNGPVMSKTLLGWVLHGNVAIRESGCTQPTESLFLIYDLSTDLTERDNLNVLHDLVKCQWKIDQDNTVNNDKEISKDDKRCIEIMDKTIQRVNNNQYEVGLFWNSDNLILPESYQTAFSRLRSLENKMDKNPEYASRYRDKFNDYVNKGFVKKLTPEESQTTSNLSWYLPHFGVVNPNKPQKLRIVFDAASKSNGVSLNDFLLTGPDLYNSLMTILLNFRRHNIAFVGDIKDMFLRIKVREEDRQAQKILWRDMDRQNPPDEYEIQVVFFGAKCSPSLAQEVKNRNAEDYREYYPAASHEIIKRHYMDDYLGGAENVEEAIALINDVIFVHSKAGFEICNWISNSKSVLDKINIDHDVHPVPKIEIGDTLKEERILGMWWNYEVDQFSYQFKFHKISPDIIELKKRPTKRDLLKVVMSLFDPLGFISNITITGKILLQDVWESGIEWDEPLTDEQYDIWVNWCSKLRDLKNFSIPRQFTLLPIKESTIQLHVFCDASKYAYAACAYLRFEFQGQIDAMLIMSKSRVAPIKPTSIPRLELQGALVGARLAKYITSSLDIAINETFLWTDSEVVLNWIKSNSRRFKVYVAQRLGEIQEISKTSDWRYVPSKLNIADDATKVKSTSLNPDDPWIKGPKFLYSDKKDWPEKRILQKDDENLDKTEFVNVITAADQPGIILPDLKFFSVWFRFLRSTAWILRLFNLLRTKARKDPLQPLNNELQPEEISQAEILIYRKIQRDSYPTEIECMMKQKCIPKNSQLRSLPIIYSPSDKLLRLNGRLDNVDNTEMDYNSKNPILLDPNHPITTLIIRHYHIKNSHIGHETIISNLRKVYWITGIRNAVKKIAYQCQYCKNKKAKPNVPIMGQLPTCRINPTARPFIKTGVDLFGPIEITSERRHKKRYGVIFTCMVTRAIHLDIVHDLSSNAFIHVWRQFGCRRGFPEELYSDNGTNFRKSDKEIRDAMNDWPHDDITRTMTMKNCKWIFNPPAAPHMGGTWERLIQTTKNYLKDLVKEKYPQSYVLRTLFCEVENMVNSRPLTHIPLESHDANPLTPNDILIGPSHKSLQFVRTCDRDLNFVSMWRAAQRFADIFWFKWRELYRQHILFDRKWSKDNRSLNENDVVLVMNPDSPRNIWPKGIIIKTYPSKDGRVRIVDVKTITGIYRRPVSKLIKLDVSS